MEKKVLLKTILGYFGRIADPSRRLDLVSKAVDFLIAMTAAAATYHDESYEEASRRAHNGGYRPYYRGLEHDEDYIREVLELMTLAAKEGIILNEWEKRLGELERFTRKYDESLSARCIREEREAIYKAGAYLAAISPNLEGISGAGLELVPMKYGHGRHVVLDGQSIASVTPDAEFGSAATDGKAVAWLIREQIDRCAVRGCQFSVKVFAWKVGMAEAKIVWSTHAYEAEGKLQVEPPAIIKGKVAINYSLGGQSAKKLVKI